MKKLRIPILFFCLLLMLCIQACQESCAPIDKSKDRISEESKAKMAYTGTETLVFLEIDNGDSTELVFKPSEHYDTMQTSYSYYEAPNGDECIGYETSTEILYREYYCEERSWQFVCGISATLEQLVLRFDELPRKINSKYNFNIYLESFRINDSSVKDTIGYVYLDSFESINGSNLSVTKITRENDEYLYYDLVNGLIQWEFEEINYSLILKELIRT